MLPLVKFLYYVSVLIALALLFFSYYQFPEYVSIGYSENTALKELKSKSDLFYIGAGLFIILNALLMILKKLVNYLPYKMLPMPSKGFWLQSSESQLALEKANIVWLNSFGIILNLFIAFLYLTLFLINVVQFGNFSNYIPIIYGFIILMSIWWIVLPIRLLYKKYEI